MVTGGSGVLGRVTTPRLRAAGHHLHLPTRTELDLLAADQVEAAVRDTDAILHLATHLPAPDRMNDPGGWHDNDRLRDAATRLPVEAALSAQTQSSWSDSGVHLPGRPRRRVDATRPRCTRLPLLRAARRRPPAAPQ